MSPRTQPRNWYPIGIIVGIILAVTTSAIALARQVTENSSRIDNLEAWFARYDGDFREMRKEVKDIWKAMYADED